MTEPLPTEVKTAEWLEARRRADAIRDFLRDHPGRSSAGDVVELAVELALSQATTYRLIRLFRAGGTVTSLLHRRRGRPQGHRTLDDRLEQIVRDTIERFYLRRSRPSLSQLFREVQTNCFAAGLSPPHRRTIEARVAEIDLSKRAKRRGENTLLKTATAVPGKFDSPRPLSVVQIDHTKADVFVVDEETRDPIGRPWLTLALDVHTRMVTGFYLSMAPSRLSTSLCLLNSVFDKSTWLRDREITEPWPVAGLPEILHVDNGADFRSRAFKRGCEDAGIKIVWRPPAVPRFGGHIERLIGTQMGSLHLLPGTTFSNPQEREGYDPKRHAALTLRDLERYIALDIVGAYHQSIHSGLSRPPLAVWREKENEIPLRLPTDRLRFWLTFLPEDERTLRPDGIHLFGLRYWSPALSADLGRTKKPLLVKYDPRDMAHIWVRRSSGGFVEARYADVTLPSVTLREAVTARRTLKGKGRGEVNMRSIIRTAIAQREIVDNARKQSIAVARGKAKRPKSMLDDAAMGSLRGVDSSKPVPFVEGED